MNSCIFCAILAGEAPAQVIAEDDRTVAFMDIQPGTRGHALVVPRTHSSDIFDADPADLAAVIRTAQRVARAAVDGLGAAGVNLVQSSGRAAFQTVFHLHLHVIPRYPDDGIRLPWVPTPGDPGEIARAAEELRAAL